MTDRDWLVRSTIMCIRDRDLDGAVASLVRLTANVSADSAPDAEKIRGVRRAVQAGDWNPAISLFGVW